MDARVETKLAARRAAAKLAHAAVPEPVHLLSWYDRHRRILPWRALPGAPADPYRAWLSEIMLQQTRVETVARYYPRFLARFPDVETLAAARLGEVLKTWAGLGYYARARNLHACARLVVKRHGGRFPDTEKELSALPGIGAYTTAAIMAIAHGKQATPVDGNVERVVARLFAVATPLPAAKAELRRIARNLMPAERPGDFAQAMMDLGATVCTPRRPDCPNCPWSGACAAFARGDPESLPRRARKVQSKLRRGAAYFVRRAGDAVLVRTRPKRGLLGGMTEVPTTEWSAKFDRKAALGEAPPLKATWRRLPGVVRHVFTHFPLELVIYSADVPKRTPAPKGMRFVPLAKLADEALPSLMRKVVRHAAGQMQKTFRI